MTDIIEDRGPEITEAINKVVAAVGGYSWEIQVSTITYILIWMYKGDVEAFDGMVEAMRTEIVRPSNE